MEYSRFGIPVRNAIHLIAVLCRRLLHRIMQRARRLSEVVVGHLEVVFGRHSTRVANPCTDDMDGELFDQFRLACAAQVLEQLRPGDQTGALSDIKVQLTAEYEELVAGRGLVDSD